MKIDENDLKLLGYLYHSNRESFVQIAKETGLSRTQVEYKYNKFMKEGIIRRFMTVFNYSAFGYPTYVLMQIKLEKFSYLNSFTHKLEKSKHCISWGECFGKYDLFSNLIFKDEKELSNFLAEVINEQEVMDYLIVKPYLTEFHPLKMLYDKQKPVYPITNNTKERKFDNKDVAILKILEENNRARIIDIAKKTNLSAELVLYKIRKLEEDKVILGGKALLNMKKLGYDYTIILINIKNFSQEVREKLISFVRRDKMANLLILSLFNPNCIIQIFHKTNDELKEEIKKIREMMKNEIMDLEIILAQEEDKINTLPFLK